jgi:hypothetical protein
MLRLVASPSYAKGFALNASIVARGMPGTSEGTPTQKTRSSLVSNLWLAVDRCSMSTQLTQSLLPWKMKFFGNSFQLRARSL